MPTVDASTMDAAGLKAAIETFFATPIASSTKKGERILHLQNANLKHTRLDRLMPTDPDHQVRFEYCTFTDCAFLDWRMIGVVFAHCTFLRVYFGSCILGNARFIASRTTYSNFNSCELWGSRFDGVITDNVFANCDFEKADFRAGNFYRNHWTHCEMRGALLNWSAHDLISGLLRDLARKSHSNNGQELFDRVSLAVAFPALLGWCWRDFLAIEHPQKRWALEALAPYAHKKHGPALLRAALRKARIPLPEEQIPKSS